MEFFNKKFFSPKKQIIGNKFHINNCCVFASERQGKKNKKRELFHYTPRHITILLLILFYLLLQVR